MVPQGTFIERIRAAGAGLAAFYTPTGIGTVVETPAKEVAEFDGRRYLLETALSADVALLRATVADAFGNCIFEGTTRNFQPAMATAAAHVIVEAERIVPVGALSPDEIHLPGLFVDAVAAAEIPLSTVKAAEIARARDPLKSDAAAAGLRGIPRDLMALRAARMLAAYRYVNLGVGIPTLVGNWLEEIGADVVLHAEDGILGYHAVTELEGWNPHYFDASSRPIAPSRGAACFDSVRAFAMARGGHLDAVALGGYEVSQHGDLANWSRPGVGADRIGGARVFVLMEHTTKDGRSRLVEECTLPLTGRRCVSTLITNLAVIEVTPDGFALRELAPGVTVEDVVAATAAPLQAPPNPPTMAFA